MRVSNVERLVCVSFMARPSSDRDLSSLAEELSVATGRRVSKGELIRKAIGMLLVHYGREKSQND